RNIHPFMPKVCPRDSRTRRERSGRQLRHLVGETASPGCAAAFAASLRITTTLSTSAGCALLRKTRCETQRQQEQNDRRGYSENGNFHTPVRLLILDP